LICYRSEARTSELITVAIEGSRFRGENSRRGNLALYVLSLIDGNFNIRSL